MKANGKILRNVKELIKITSAACKAFVFIVLLNPFMNIRAQEHHDHGAEHYFDHFNQYTLIQLSGVERRYVAESQVRQYVDLAFSNFYDAIQNRMEENPDFSHDEFESLANQLVQQVQAGVQEIAPREDTYPPVAPLQINGPCENMDFEWGNYNGWTASMAFRTDGNLYDFSGAVTSPPPAAQCQVVTGGVDPNVPAIPRVFPGAGGGNFSIRLGQTNFNINENRAVRLEQTFMVDNTNKFFLYHYAIVFEAPNGHTPNQRPYFIVDIIDGNGQPIQCAHYSVVVDAANQGDFQVINGNIFYKNWTTVFTNLEPYIGQNVTVRFQVADCSLTGHQAYAYIEASCGFQDITASPTTFCPGQTSTLTAPAGLGSYSWSTGQNTQSIVVNTPGTYTVQLIPVQGPQCAATLQTTVSQYPAPVTNFTSNAPQCLGTGVTFTDNSTIQAPATIQNYQWDFGNGIVTPLSNGNIVGVPNTSGTYTNPSHNYAGAGNYQVVLTVTSSDGCTNSATLPITVHPLPDITITAIDDVNCFGGNDGSITTNTLGGTAPYSWTINGNPGGPNFNNLTAGAYTVQVTDNHGCTDNAQANVGQPAAALDLTVTMIDDVNCFGGNDGSINTNTTGGTAPYGWTINGNPGGPNFGGLAAGAYTIQVTDNNGCTDNFVANVGQPAAALDLTVTLVDDVNCFGGSDGSISTNTIGGTAPYSWTIDGTPGGPNFNNLGASTYTLVVTDNNGCTDVEVVNVGQPAAALDITVTMIDDVNCFGGNDGSINTNTTGGTAPYSWTINGNPGGPNFSNLITGTYLIQVTDNNGCTDFVQANVGQPAAALDLTVTLVDDVNCFGGNDGSINTNTNGGTAPYSWTINGNPGGPNYTGLTAGAYTIQATDNNGCTDVEVVNVGQPAAALDLTVTMVDDVNCFGGNDGSINTNTTGGTAPYSWTLNGNPGGPNFGGLTAGAYTIQATDNNGCTDIEVVNVSQPAAALDITITATDDVNCFGGNDGSINTNTTGGTAPYSWTINGNPGGPNFNNLTAGAYAIQVTDNNGCVDNELVNISQPAAALDLTVTMVDDVNCFGGNDGSINTNTSGGTAPYIWTINGNPGGPNFGGLTAGTYHIQVIDDNGCVDNAVANINQPLGPLTISSATTTNPTCNGMANGSIDLIVMGGTWPYTFNWSHGATDEDVYLLPAGTYNITITDNQGCVLNGSYTLTEPPLLQIEANTKDLLCYGLSNGYIEVTVNGGVAPYQYVWSNGSMQEDLTEVGAGTYTLTVFDANMCNISDTYTIYSPDPIVIESMEEEYTIYVGEEVVLNANVSGGAGGFTYLWSPADWLDCNTCLNPVASPLLTTEYVLLVADQNGCTEVASSTVKVLYTLYVPNTFSPNGDGINETFNAVSRSCKEYRMAIFNRWGDKVFETDDINQGWDGYHKGVQAKQDVYSYRIEAKFYNGEYHELIGQVNLIR